MEVSIDSQLERVLNSINVLDEDLEKATIYALNLTISWMKERLIDEISEKKRLKLKAIRYEIGVNKANKRDLNARLTAKRGHIWIKYYEDKRQTPVGVYAGGKMYPHAFIARLRPGASEGVYRRVGKARFPVRQVSDWLVEDMSKAIGEILEDKEVIEVFNRYFEREIRRVTGVL